RSRYRLPLRLETLEDRTVLSTFTVTNTNDSGPGSLRQAISDATAAAGTKTGAFNIGGGGAPSTRRFPFGLGISRPLILDGTTPPGYSGTPLIEVNGSQISGNPNSAGLAISGNDVTVRGLVINGFTGSQVRISGNRDVLAGNYVGTDIT